MDYHQFVKSVQLQAGFPDRGQAVKAIEATLRTLAERLFAGEADQLAAQLPQELQPYLTEPKEHQNFQVEEFLERVGSREGIDAEMAEKHAKDVISVLCRAVSQGEMEDVISQLPDPYLRLFGLQSKTMH